jgi:hypothetical protein
LESSAETQRCDDAKKSVKLKKADFAQKYFYIFALNLKFCGGIKKYKKSLSLNQTREEKG